MEDKIFDLFLKIDGKLDTHTEKLAKIETKMESFQTKEMCEKKCAEDKGINIQIGKKKVAIGAGILVALGSAIAAIIAAF
jgi:hypothetical protein